MFHKIMLKAFYLIILIPLIGFIWILVLFCTDGVKEDNKWGSNPKLIDKD